MVFTDAIVLKIAGGRVTDDTFRSMGVVGSITPVGLVVVLHHTGEYDDVSALGAY